MVGTAGPSENVCGAPGGRALLGFRHSVEQETGGAVKFSSRKSNPFRKIDTHRF
jgi:hypothetical protein